MRRYDDYAQKADSGRWEATGDLPLTPRFLLHSPLS